LLLVLDGCERAALTPMQSDRLHRFAYFANCMAPVYDLPAADGKILKYRRGPFYPDLQWDVDRLWVMGLVERRSVRLVEDTFGWWFSAEYALTRRGVEAVAVVLESPRQQRMYAFVAELAAAYSALGEAARDDAAFVDATYGDPQAKFDSLIDFGEWESTEARNRSVATAEAFDAHAPYAVRLGRRDRLHLYFRYLDRASGRVARRVG
jgi:hypothetical protein